MRVSRTGLGFQRLGCSYPRASGIHPEGLYRGATGGVRDLAGLASRLTYVDLSVIMGLYGAPDPTLLKRPNEW